MICVSISDTRQNLWVFDFAGYIHNRGLIAIYFLFPGLFFYVYVNSPKQPTKTQKAPHHKPQTPETRHPNPKSPFHSPNPKKPISEKKVRINYEE